MDLQNLRQFIKKWQDITIITPKDPQSAELEQSLSLFYILKELGKDVNILIDKIGPDHQPIHDFQPNLPKKFTISIDTSNKEIEEMRYEKKENQLDIFLILKKGELLEKDIFLEPFQGDQMKKPTLLIASGIKNPPFLPVNFLNPLPKIKLLARVLNKLEFKKEKEVYSACLSSNDFLSSAAKQKDLSFVVSELKTNTWKLPSLLLLWENCSSPLFIKGIFYSSKKDLIKRILDNFAGASKGNGVLFSTAEINLSLAKEKILNLL